MNAKHALVVFTAFAIGAAACSKNNSNPASPACTATAGAPSTSNFGPEGGTGTIAVSAAAACSWTAASGSSFLTITSGAAGTGNGAVTFSVATNSGSDRSGTITAAGTAVTISQRAAATTPPPGSVTLAAPVARSPIGGASVDVARPTLTVTNAVATGTPGTVTYRFEISDQSSFPVDAARTFSVDGVAQGSGTTSGVVPRDLGPSVLWYWHARATSGTVTSAYSATETFRTPSTCTYALLVGAAVGAGGGTQTVTVTTDAACAWTATSNASFVTVASGASGSGNGTVTLTIAANSTGVARTGTVSIAGQTVTVTQPASGLSVGFQMKDPGRGPEIVTDCQIRSPGGPTTCLLESTSFPLGTSTIVSYAWTVEYDYPFRKTFTGTDSTMTFAESCGQVPSSATGEPVPLFVTLTVTDSLGQAVTVRSGSGSQPALRLLMFTCGS